MIVGLTGGIGSGKSLVEATWVAAGIPVLDTDRVARELTAANGAALPQIAAAFGEEVLTKDDGLDRAKVREIVFADRSSRAKLESILHAQIHDIARNWIAERASAPLIVLAVPLLFESGRMLTFVHRTVVVDCLERTQISRVMARSRLTAPQVERIMAAQASREVRLSRADDVIDNDTNSKTLGQIAAINALNHLRR
jgi:dephospho-CoA kinase